MEKAKKSEDSLMKVIIKLFKNSRRVIFLTLLVIVASVVMTLFQIGRASCRERV